MVRLVIVELTNQYLQNPCNAVLTLTKNLLIVRTKILFAFINSQLKKLPVNRIMDRHN